jgi:hypothetical protein
MQTIRGQSAAAAATSMETALGAARDSEISNLTGPGGMTRDQIEQRQFEISQQIFDLEEKREAKQLAIRDLQDQVYAIETGRLQNAQDRLDKLQEEVDKQLEAIDRQRQKWQDADLAQKNAAIRAGKYNDVLRVGRLLVGDIVKNWNSIKDRIAKLYIEQVILPPGVKAPRGTSSTSSANQNTTIGSQGYTPGQLQQYVRDLGSTSAAVRTRASAALSSKKMMYGGVVKKMARGGMVGGTGMGDSVPTLLQPGEFVVNKAASRRFMPMLKQMNDSKFPGMIGRGGMSAPIYSLQSSTPVTTISSGTTSSGVDNSAVYNYNLTVSVNGGNNMDPNRLANVVMTRIKQMDGHRIRRQSV